ncbi:hypothetical protein NUSPORA_01201 [Nucleospora cyclopteri]
MDMEKLQKFNEKHKLLEHKPNQVVIPKENFKNLKDIEKQTLMGKIDFDSLRKFLNENDSSDCLRILTRKFDDFLEFDDFYENMRQFNNERSKFLHVIDANTGIQTRIKLITLISELMLLSICIGKIFSVENVFEMSVLPVIIFLLPIFYHIFTPFLFLIYHRPYMIGDRIILNDETYIVQDIFLSYTLFEKWNNDCVIIPNIFIKDKFIKNIRRSNHQMCEIEFLTSSKTSDQKIKILRKKMEKFVSKSSCFDSVLIVTSKVVNCNFYRIHAIIKHNINHQNSFFMWKIQNRFMTEFIRQCNGLNISYHPMVLNMVAQKK